MAPFAHEAGGGQGSQKKEDGKAQGSAVDDAAVGGGDRGTMVHGDLLLCIFMQGRCRTAKTGCIAYIIIASGQRAFKENGKSMFFYTRGIAQKIC